MYLNMLILLQNLIIFFLPNCALLLSLLNRFCALVAADLHYNVQSMQSIQLLICFPMLFISFSLNCASCGSACKSLRAGCLCPFYKKCSKSSQDTPPKICNNLKQRFPPPRRENGLRRYRINLLVAEFVQFCFDYKGCKKMFLSASTHTFCKDCIDKYVALNIIYT